MASFQNFFFVYYTNPSLFINELTPSHGDNPARTKLLSVLQRRQHIRRIFRRLHISVSSRDHTVFIDQIRGAYRGTDDLSAVFCL